MVTFSPEITKSQGDILNREQWDEMVDFHIQIAETTGETDLAVAFMDINFFKRVNDEISYEKGNEIIADVGSLLAEVSTQFRTHGNEERQSDVVAHGSMNIDARPGKWGGDEFAVLIHADREETQGFVNRIREVFNDYIERPEQAELKNLGVGIAIGTSMYESGMSREDLTSESSENMKQDKQDQLPALSEQDRELYERMTSILSRAENPDVLLCHIVKR